MTIITYFGINEGQSAVMLPQLRKEDMSLTTDQETWIASLGFLLAPVISIIMGPVLDLLGRKRGLQYFYLNAGLGYAVTSSAQGFYQICVGRIICGLVSGQITIGVVYLAEISTVKQREYFFAVLTGMASLGVVLSNIIGGYLSWKTASAIYSATSFVLFIAMCFIPESPSWLFKMGRKDDCIKSFQKLGRGETDIRREIEILELQCKESTESIRCGTFLEPTVWKPFLIIIVFYFLQSFSGIYNLLYYSIDFIESLGTTYDPLKISILLATTKLLTTCTIVIVFRSRFGRKFSLAISCFFMTVAYVGLGTYEYIHDGMGISVRQFQWLPVGFLVLQTIAAPIGMFGLPSIMVGEIFPLKVRGLAASLSAAICNCFLLISIKNYRNLTDLIQSYGLTSTYAVVSLIGFFFAIYILPETQNKSLHEIELSFLPKEKEAIANK